MREEAWVEDGRICIGYPGGACVRTAPGYLSIVTAEDALSLRGKVERCINAVNYEATGHMCTVTPKDELDAEIGGLAVAVIHLLRSGGVK